MQIKFADLNVFLSKEKQIGHLLGGVKYSYAFDLLMETRDKDKKFPVYDIGGNKLFLFI